MADAERPAALPPAALPDWIADHLKRYLATYGADGSGSPRQLPLIYGKNADRFVIVASRGGAPDHPG